VIVMLLTYILEVLCSNLGLDIGCPEDFCRFVQSLLANSWIVPRFDHERFRPNPSQFTTHLTIPPYVRGGLISLWLYKEKKLRDWKKMYLLYIFPPPPELHTFMTSLF
jgi:hypothetical protein